MKSSNKADAIQRLTAENLTAEELKEKLASAIDQIWTSTIDTAIFGDESEE